MSKILYFGNLPFTTTAADLTKLVKPFSAVLSARIGRDRKTYKSRGFGFVEVPDEAAKAVIAILSFIWMRRMLSRFPQQRKTRTKQIA